MQDTSASLSAAPDRRASRARFGMLGLIATGTLVNYLDRTVLGIAAPALTSELAINSAVMGIVFSAFSWSYAASQVPGGLFLDRFGTRLTYALSVSFWSLFTLLHAFAGGLAGWRPGLSDETRRQITDQSWQLIIALHRSR